MTEHEEQIAYFNELYAAAQLPETWVITDKNNNPTCEIDLKNYARIGFKFGLGYAHEQASNSWISVEERLPEKQGFYLVFTAIGTTSECQFHCDEFVESYVQFQEVTHWRPLPEPPTVREDE